MPPLDDAEFVDAVDEPTEPIEAEEPVADEAPEAGDGDDVEPDPAGDLAPEADTAPQTYTKEELEASIATAVSESRKEYESLLGKERNKWEQSGRQARLRQIQNQRKAQEARKLQAAQKQNTLPSLQDWIAGGGNVEAWEIFNGQRQAVTQQTQQISRRLDAMENASRVRADSADIEAFIDTGMAAALKKHPDLESPKWKNRLGNLVYAEAVRMSGPNADIRRLDIMSIADGLSEAIGDAVKTARKKATKKIASAPGGSPQGSPTKPVKKKTKPMNTEEWLDNGFEDLEKDLKPRV